MKGRHGALLVLLMVGGGLVALAVLSFVLSYLPLGAWETPLALVIAGAKALGIGIWFMELDHARVSIRVAIAAAISLFLLLVGLTTLDVFTRAPSPAFAPYENFQRGG